MSPNDKRAPTRDEWSEVVSRATDQVRRETEAGLDPSGPRLEDSFLLVVFGLFLAALVALWVPRVTDSGAEVSLPVAEQGEDLRIEAGLLVQEIEAYRAERGTLPPDDYLAPYLGDGFEYQVVDRARGQYIVRRRAGDVVVTYDGSMSLQLWLLLGGTSGGGE